VYISLEGRERELHRLLVVSLASGVAGLVVAVLAARFLALRALLPIQRMVSQQEQFVADASHELRTPLALLRADVEILQRSLRRTPPNSTPKTRVRRSGEDKASAAAQQLSTDEGEVLDEIHEELGRMTALVRDLLTLATYDAGTQLPPLSSVSLTPLLVEVTERLQRAIVQAQQRLHLLLPEDGDALVVMGNPEALRRLLLILLTNAIAYTPPGGQIWLQAREVAGKQVEIMVRDTGQGIASEDVPHLFIRFYRAEPARPRQPLITDGEAPGGTGLGLAIAKAIVERHQGTITATSPREGQGSTFAVTFKLARQARDKASTRRSAGKAC
jgi:signal transduction histidine kinase